MATIKISELEEVTELSSGDVLPIVNNNETKKVSIEKLNEILGGNTDDTSATKALKIEYYKDGATFDTEENRKTISEYYTALREGEAPELFIAFNEFDGSVSGDNSYMYRASVISIDDYNLSLYCPTQVNTSSSQNRYGVNYNERYELEINVGIDSSNNNYNATYINHYYTKGWSLNGNSSILGMNNTTAFTPTGDYNPATKKYVDDAVANSGASGSNSTNINNIYEIVASQNLGTSISDFWSANDIVLEAMNKYLKNEIDIPSFRITGVGGNSPVYSRDTYLRIGSISNLTYNYFGSHLAIQEVGFENSLMLHSYSMTFTLRQDSATGNYVLNGSVSWNYNRRRVLADGINASYAPTGDYNPATKKYVDDAVANAITSAITTVLEAEY